jgi:ribosomal protein S4
MLRYPNKTKFQYVYQLKENIFESSKIVNKKKYLNRKWKIFGLGNSLLLRNSLAFNKERKLNYKKKFKNSTFLKKKIKIFYGNLKDYQLKFFFFKSNKRYSYFLKRKLAKNLRTRTNSFSSTPCRRGFLSENLERRLDILCFRLKFAPSMPLLGQLIRHNFFQVNGEVCSYRNRLLKPGDFVTINPLKIKKLTKILKAYPKKIRTKMDKFASLSSEKKSIYRTKNLGIFLDIPHCSLIRYPGKRVNFLNISLLFH